MRPLRSSTRTFSERPLILEPRLDRRDLVRVLGPELVAQGRRTIERERARWLARAAARLELPVAS